MRITARFALFALVLQLSTLSANDAAPVPNVDLQPDQVIKIVVDALKNNDESNNDDGIATVYRFASPGNRAYTGPIERFTRMIKNGFSDMLNHSLSRFGEIELTDDTALQAVWLTTPGGDIAGYVFQMRKQDSGDYANMWMTESVWPLGKRKPAGQSI